MKNTLIIIFTLLFSSQVILAQGSKRANNLFNKRAYIQAAELFLKEKDKDQQVLEKLGDCYFFTSDMKNAAKWYDLLLKKYESKVDKIYFLRYGQALKGLENYDLADEWLQKYYKTEMSTEAFIEELNNNMDRIYVIDTISTNTEVADFGPSFYTNGDIVFASSRDGGDKYAWNGQGYLNLYQGNIVPNTNDIINVAPFSEEITTKMHEATTAFTKDGKTMYFTRNNFLNNKKGRASDKGTHLKIYRAELIDSVWKNITELPFNNDEYSVEHPALSADEKTLFFSSDMPSTIGSFDLYMVHINEDGSFTEPQNLGPEVNTPQREQFPFVSSDNTLYFASDGHIGIGGLDIFKTKVTAEGNFERPMNLGGQINSSMDDFGFIVDHEKEMGYFSSNRPGGKGDDDIYSFTELMKYNVSGIVQNKYSKQPLPGTLVQLFNVDGNIISETVVGEDGKYEFEIYKNNKYNVKASKELYVPYDVSFTAGRNDVNKDLYLILEAYADLENVIVLENGKTQIKINNIYFDYKKHSLRDEAKPELDKVADIMKKYPELRIEVGAHTDYRGSEKFNLRLSDKRANSVKEYLVSQEVPAESITTVGYGEAQPLIDCTKDGGECTEEQNTQNRRCEFILTN